MSAWERQAACRGLGDDTMFPNSEDDARRVIATFCHGCPVRLQCTLEGRTLQRPVGIWGGKFYGNGNTGRQAPQTIATNEARLDLYMQGLTDTEIARAQGVSPRAISQWRERNGLSRDEVRNG